MNYKKHFQMNLDVDGVLFDYEAAIRNTLITTFDVAPSDIPVQSDWGFSTWPVIEGTYEGFLKVHTAGFESGMFETGEMLPNASKVLWELEEEFGDVLEITILTHRFGLIPQSHAAVAAQTITWLQRTDSAGRVLIPHHHLSICGGKDSAGAKLNNLGDLYVDDSSTNCNAFASNGRDVLVFDQMYNRDCTVGTRVYNWEDAKPVIAARIEEWVAKNS